MTSPVERVSEKFEAQARAIEKHLLREAEERLRQENEKNLLQEAEWDILSSDLAVYIALVTAQFKSFRANVMDWSVSDFAVLHAAEFEGGSRTVHKPATTPSLLWNPITRYLWLLEWKLGTQGLDGER